LTNLLVPRAVGFKSWTFVNSTPCNFAGDVDDPGAVELDVSPDD